MGQLGKPVMLRSDFSAQALRRLAAEADGTRRSRRLLALAAVLDGASRQEAAEIGEMDRQTLRDWVHRFNEHGPDGLFDNWYEGRAPSLNSAQLSELTRIIKAGPRKTIHGVTRWSPESIQIVISDCFGVQLALSTVEKLLTHLVPRRTARRKGSRTQADRSQ